MTFAPQGRAETAHGHARSGETEALRRGEPSKLLAATEDGEGRGGRNDGTGGEDEALEKPRTKSKHAVPLGVPTDL